VLEQRWGLGPGKEEGKTLGRCDQGGGEASALASAHARLGVPSARLDSPGEAEVFDRSAKCRLGVSGESTQWRHPEHPKRCCCHAPPSLPSTRKRGPAPLPRWIIPQPLQYGAHPRRIGLSGSGCRVNQPALTGEVGAPDLFLEGERLPAFAGKPITNTGDWLAVATDDGGCGSSRFRGSCYALSGLLCLLLCPARAAKIYRQGRPASRPWIVGTFRQANLGKDSKGNDYPQMAAR
jgi:hypothetical protein